MTDIVVGVRLNADGSGLVGQLKLSKTELDNLGVAEKGAADAARDLSQASDQAAKSQARAAQGARQTSAATADLTKNVGLARAGWQQVGFQVQDVFASYASGSKLTTIFAQQSGQLASAIALIAQASEGTNGKLKGLATFLGGPWGIALGIAVSAGAALIPVLTKTAEAEKLAEAGASGLSDAQSVLGEIFDLTSGKIKTQNDLLIANARLTAINLRSEAIAQRASSQKTFGNADDMSATQRARGVLSAFLPDSLGSLASGDYYGARERQGALRGLEAERARIGTIADQKQRDAAISRFMARVEKTDFSGLAVGRNEYLQAFVDNLSATQKDKVAQQIDQSLDSGVLANDLRREDHRKPKKDNSAEKAAREAERLAQFSLRAAEAVARIDDEYNTAPRDIDRARAATAQLDTVIRDVNKRLESGKNLTAGQRDELNKVKASAEALKPVIQASLVRPITDMLESQQRQIDLGALQVSGRKAEADALQLTYTLMDKLGVKSEEQLAAELQKRGVTADQVHQLYDNLDVLRQQTREMQKQQAIQQAFLGAINDQRENVRLTLESLRKDGPKAFGDFFKRSLDVVDRLFSEVATEKLFGGLFRDLEDQVTGADKVSEAGDRMAKAVDAASGEIVNLGKAAGTAIATMKGTAISSAVPTGWIVGDDGKAFDPNAAIEVTAGKIDPLKELKSGFKEGYEQVFTDLKKGLKDVFSDIFGDRGLFSSSLGKTLGGVLGNAQVGSAAGSLVTGLFGINGSQTGGMIGGALGGAIGKAVGGALGPLGSILGGTLGSIVGGLFKKAKYGTAVITGGGEDDVSVGGNNGTRKKAASGLAGSVQDAIANIADEFGGTVGNFNTSIGIYKDNYRVSTTGRTGKLKGGSGRSDIKDFGKDGAEEAIAYAVMDAITDGGIVGISAAVQKALRSSTDLDKAVQEALKVKEVETLLGGLGAELANQFKTFEKQAQERVRIATEYGFDVVAIEKKNAEDRAKLVDQILTDRVGSLQTFLDNTKYGDLFEGSLADQRQALLMEIAKAKTAAEAGKDGAADTLATLSRQLIELSRDAYGTAGGEYASDRESSISAAEKVIQLENDRIRVAQETATQSNAALQTISANSTETNSLLSQLVTEIQIFGQTVAIPNGAYIGANVARSS